MLLRVSTLLLPLALSMLCGLPSGGGDDAEDEEATNEIRIREVVFARGVTEEFELEGGPVAEFRANETAVAARVTLVGRPRGGIVNLNWMWRDIPIADAAVDLAEVNGDLLFSVGQDTFIRSTLNANRLYIGTGHRLVVSTGGTELGSYNVTVVPPEGARPSSFGAAQLYGAFDPQRGPSDPRTTFAPNETLHIAGQVAIGHLSWFDAMFTLNGQEDPTMTQEAIGNPGGGDMNNFIFSVAKPGGWPPGSHRVRLVLDDQAVAAFDFIVTPATP